MTGAVRRRVLLKEQVAKKHIVSLALKGSGGSPVEMSLLRPLGEDGEWPALSSA